MYITDCGAEKPGYVARKCGPGRRVIPDGRYHGLVRVFVIRFPGSEDACFPLADDRLQYSNNREHGGECKALIWCYYETGKLKPRDQHHNRVVIPGPRRLDGVSLVSRIYRNRPRHTTLKQSQPIGCL